MTNLTIYLQIERPMSSLVAFLLIIQNVILFLNRHDLFTISSYFQDPKYFDSSVIFNTTTTNSIDTFPSPPFPSTSSHMKDSNRKYRNLSNIIFLVRIRRQRMERSIPPSLFSPLLGVKASKRRQTQSGFTCLRSQRKWGSLVMRRQTAGI